MNELQNIQVNGKLMPKLKCFYIRVLFTDIKQTKKKKQKTKNNNNNNKKTHLPKAC